MATKAKESSVVGKEKKAPSSNSHVTSTQRTSKPSTTTKANTSPSEKNIPNYLKPTISSRLDQPKSDAPNKPPPNRRRSLDKPLSSSNLTTKQNHPSPNSRLHKALVSPGPRERSLLPLRSSNVPLKSNNLSKPISDRTSKTPNDVKTKTVLFAKSTKKSTPSLSTSTSTKKKLANDHASADSTNAAKSTTEPSYIETEEVKEVTNQEVEVIKVENDEEHEIEHVSEVSPNVHTEYDVLEESDLPHNQADNEKIISTVSEEEEEEVKAEDEHKEEENTNQGESISNESHIEEHSAAEEEATINEKEEQESGVIIEDHKSENKKEEEAMEEKEAVEGGGGGVSERVEEVKAEPTSSRQQLTTVGKGKKESQVSNDVIEETASKLLEERKNKVRALAGAFQTVIDYQTPSK